jgi:arabinogalactan oligomer/maltooligosaccharide transport system permease protein
MSTGQDLRQARVAPAAAPPADPTGPVRRRGDRSRGASLLLHTTLSLAGLVALFPVAWIGYISLGPGTDDFLHPERILGRASLSNYGYVLFHTDFFTWFANSVIVGLGTMVFGVLIAASAGYAVSRMRFPGHRQLMWTFLLTQMFPVSVLLVPLYTVMAKLDLLNSYQGLILIYCSTVVPFCAFMMKGYFDTIPVEIDEAGRIDGLSPFGVFWRLIVPLARPGLAVAGFYSFLTAWGEVAYSSIFMLSSDKYTLAVGIQTFVSEYSQQWNLMAAMAVLVAIPAALVFYLVQKHLVTGLTAGGTKG